MIDWLQAPRRVIALDVETTGFGETDRVVSLGAVAFTRENLIDGEFSADFAYLIFNPGRPSEFGARAVHGFSDLVLSRQDTFGEHAGVVGHFLAGADLLVAHNAEFDLRFIQAEFARAGASVSLPGAYCTMKAQRSLKGGRVNLDATAAGFGLRRFGARHSAIEDAWLAMMIFLAQIGVRFQADFPATELAYPSNLKGAISR